MESKIKFLENYSFVKNPDIKIFKADEIKQIPKNTIPEVWYTIFEIEDMQKRIDSMLEIWKKYCSKELSLTINCLEQNTIAVELIRVNERYIVLYSIKMSDGEIKYYQGGNTLEGIQNSALEKVWDTLTISTKQFYENVHNGFDAYTIKSKGLCWIPWVTYFGDDDLEWGILEDLEEPLQIDINATFGFFDNGAGGYVAIDTSNNDIDNAVVWFSDDQPEYHVNFWDVVDEWIIIGMES